MGQHYTRNTRQVKHWCPTCRRETMHRVDDRRLGPCTEHGAAGPSGKQRQKQKDIEAEEIQPGLFPDQPKGGHSC